MAEVAAVAGVSHQTVSRVINGFPGVRPQTREKVQAAVDQLGYRRNLAARALVTRQSRLIGVIAVGSFLYGPTSTLASLERAARDHSYLTLIATIAETSDEQFSAALDEFLERSVEAIIVIASRESLVWFAGSLDLDIPLIIVGPRPADLDQLTCLSVDQTAGAELAVTHLAELGHRDVTLLAGPANWVDAQRRFDGALTQSEMLGIQPRIARGDWSPGSGYAAGVKIAQLQPEARPTAVFCANDHMALGLLAAFHAHRISVPDEISVIGFDDLPGSGFYFPALTTIHQDFDALGTKVIKAALAMISGATPDTDPVPPKLVKRESTAAPRS
ncbi:hypothetical protein CFRA_09135 [Corynebacterium frankenforstense DSM 45800]|uniref:HTH lacI-type domain-containing protein n=1 Tax=Corynebacterium frankenforstense DSM 45800 TaxID=1437875 RepID=A0A1L7CU61_9CORY|nr:LacI family DNA-binding transcriptional regulator [Corynebacterium frankenforstense]APT89386.1 hypothetical protein CFRA_09135 [Corynebacterium frankenforstense DSM 45800]